MRIRFKALTVSLLSCLIICCIFAVHRVHAQKAPHRVEISAKRFDFTPAEITVRKGEPVTLVLTSQDVSHGLRFKELNVIVKANKGERKEVTFTPDKTGTFIGQCSVFCGSGHGSMKMILHVTE